MKKLLAFLAILLLVSCTGPQGPAGQDGNDFNYFHEMARDYYAFRHEMVKEYVEISSDNSEVGDPINKNVFIYRSKIFDGSYRYWLMDLSNFNPSGNTITNNDIKDYVSTWANKKEIWVDVSGGFINRWRNTRNAGSATEWYF